jgi:hypothetical protein
MKKMSGWRKITVDGIEYRYRIGKSYAVIQMPDGTSLRPRVSDLNGRSPYHYDEGQWDGTPDGMVTPGHICSWIRKHLSEKTGRTPLLRSTHCAVCGKIDSACDCPECPDRYCKNGIGCPKCYDLGHLEPANDSVAAFCKHIGIEPVTDALRSIYKHCTEHVWLVVLAPHRRTGKKRVYYHDVETTFLPAYTRLHSVGVGGIAWDGSDWEWAKEVKAGGDWSQLDQLRHAFHEALAEHDALAEL